MVLFAYHHTEVQLRQSTIFIDKIEETIFGDFTLKILSIRLTLIFFFPSSLLILHAVESIRNKLKPIT
jgi:hypothetical protein